jgi:hypothetical protein
MPGEAEVVGADAAARRDAVSGDEEPVGAHAAGVHMRQSAAITPRCQDPAL